MFMDNSTCCEGIYNISIAQGYEDLGFCYDVDLED